MNKLRTPNTRKGKLVADGTDRRFAPDSQAVGNLKIITVGLFKVVPRVWGNHPDCAIKKGRSSPAGGG